MSGRLFIVCGPPGAGKSTYAYSLATKTQAALLELDTASEPIIQAALTALARNPNDRDSAFYKKTFREPVYEVLFALAEENLPHTDVIVVGPFTRELKNSNWPDELQQRFATAVEIHYVFCAPDVRQKRLQKRANPRDQAKLEDWTSHASYYAGSEGPAFPCQRIDTGR